MIRGLFAYLAALMALCLSPALLSAQAVEPPDLTTSGTATIKHDPQILRLQMDVTAEGPTTADAVAKLKQTMDADRAKLSELGATADSIAFAGPNTGSANPQMDQMRMQLAQRAPAGAAAAANTKPSVSVFAHLTAEWPVKPGDASARLVAAKDLEDKIKAAGLTGPKKALTPQEQEIQDEMPPGMADQMGQVTLMWVWKPTDQDRAPALAEAFKKAQGEAALLAAATGRQVGDLRHVSAQITPDMSDADSNASMQRYYAMEYQRSMAEGADSADELVSAQPTAISADIKVTVTFGLK